MESIEKTPTPREALHAVKKKLDELLTDERAFYSKLNSLDEGEEDKEAEIETTKALYDQLFTGTFEQEETEEDASEQSDEVIGKVDYLALLKEKLAELESAINESLETDNFASLEKFIHTADTTLQNEPVGGMAAGTQIDIEGNIDVLNKMYKEYVDKVQILVTQLDEEPEFNLT